MKNTDTRNIQTLVLLSGQYRKTFCKVLPVRQLSKFIITVTAMCVWYDSNSTHLIESNMSDEYDKIAIYRIPQVFIIGQRNKNKMKQQHPHFFIASQSTFRFRLIFYLLFLSKTLNFYSAISTDALPFLNCGLKIAANFRGGDIKMTKVKTKNQV